MRRISTFIALFCLVAASQKISAQGTCSFTTIDPGTMNPLSQKGITTSSFVWSPNTPGTFANSTSTSVTSPIYYYNSAQSAVTFSIDLKSTATGNNSSDVTAYRIDVYRGNPVVSYYCTGSAFNVSQTGSTYYFSIPMAMPASTNFQIKLTLTVTNTGNNSKNISSTTFGTDANLAVSGAALPVNFLGLESKKVSNGTQLTWKVAQEEGVVNYALERSADGKNFSTVGAVAATGSSSYSLTDNQATTSTVYYRVRNNDKDGRYKYSTTIKVEGGKVSFLKKAYPMPAANEVFVQHDAAAAGAIITLTAQDGRVIKRIPAQTATMQTRIDLSGLNSGLYMVRYDDGTGNGESLKVVKQ